MNLAEKAVAGVVGLGICFAFATAIQSYEEHKHPAEDGVKVLADKKYTNITGGEVDSRGCPGKINIGRNYDATDANGNTVKRRVCFGTLENYVLER